MLPNRNTTSTYFCELKPKTTVTWGIPRKQDVRRIFAANTFLSSILIPSETDPHTNIYSTKLNDRWIVGIAIDQFRSHVGLRKNKNYGHDSFRICFVRRAFYDIMFLASGRCSTCFICRVWIIQRKCIDRERTIIYYYATAVYTIRHSEFCTIFTIKWLYL